jgi:hypothetical protein
LVTIWVLVWFILPLVGFLIGAINVAVGHLLRRIASRPAQAPFGREEAATMEVDVPGEGGRAG